MLRAARQNRSPAVHIWRRLAHCVGCGSNFQDATPHTPGYIRSSKARRHISVKGQVSLEAKELLSQASADSYENHGHNADNSTFDAMSAQQTRVSSALTDHSLHLCSWCKDAKHSRFVPSPAVSDLSEVLDQIPHSSTVFHVLDARDFPLSLVPEVTARFGERVHYVVNRADQILPQMSGSPQLHDFTMNEIFRDLGVEPSRVHIVSARQGINIRQLAKHLGSRTYFVGKTGCGKTSLIAALCGLNYRAFSFQAPFITRTFIEHRGGPVAGHRLLVDTPSFPENTLGGQGNFALLANKYVTRALGGKAQLDKRGHYSSKPVTGYAGNTLSLAGILGLQLPSHTRHSTLKVSTVVEGFVPSMAHSFKNPAKISEINSSRDPNHYSWSMINTRDETIKVLPLVRLDSISIVKTVPLPSIAIRGIGFFHPSLVGQFPSDYRITVWGLEGLEFGFRSEIRPWLNSQWGGPPIKFERPPENFQVTK